MIERSNDNKISKYLEYLSIASYAGALIYSIGYFYCWGFSLIVPIPLGFIEIPRPFYLYYLILILLIDLLIITLSYNYSLKRPHNFTSALKGNLIIIVLIIEVLIIIAYIFYSMFTISQLSKYIFVFLGFILIFIEVFIIKSLLENSKAGEPRSIARDVFKWMPEPHFGKGESRIIAIILFFAILFLISLIFAIFLGYLAASNLCQEATLYLKEPQEDIDGKTFLFVMHDEKNNYLVEKDDYLSSIPSYYPILYIIPDDSIKLIKYYG